MSPKKPLSSPGEELPQTPDSGTTQVRSKIRERNEEALAMAHQSVEQCLISQREVADLNPKIQRFRQLNPHTQREHMEEKPVRLFYYLERAFSLPEDYREFIGKTSRIEEKEHIESLVLHPEFFTDDFLIRLGVCDRYNLYRRRISEKLEQRVEVIPQIKEAFIHSEQLPFGERKKTARIVSFNQPGKPWHGKYILSQEQTGLTEIDGVKRKITKIVPHIFNDIFSLARSQEKAIKTISNRSEQVDDLKQRLDTLLLSWHSLLDDERRKKIQELRSELEKKKTFHELHALKSRLEKIDFSHTQTDTARIIGAWNDIEKSWQEKSGKKGSISEQTETLRSMIRMEMRRFGIMYQKFLTTLESLDHTDLERSMQAYQDGEEDIVLSPHVRDHFRTLLPVLREYTEFHGRQPFVGMPFSPIHQFIGYIYTVLRKNTESDRTKVRAVLIATLYLKLSRVRIGLHNIEDRIKSAHMVLSETDTIDICRDIETFITDLNTIHLLEGISIGNETHLKFIGYTMVLRSIRRALREEDIQEVLKQIDTITENI